MTDSATVGLSRSFGETLRRDRQNRAPDVLNTIANLSSDEVFTSPEFANKMLDTLAKAWAADHEGASIWADRNVTFLDPATKSGVFLREITKRLVEGQGDPPEGSDRRKALLDRVLTNQVFGIGMTTLTSLLARRSIYCSKDATSKHSVAPSLTEPDGNIWFQRTEHTWVGDKCGYCPANKTTYDRGEEAETHAYAFIHTTDPASWVAEHLGASMHFDVIIGNPPYQLGDSGGDAIGSFAMPLYQKFVKAAKALGPSYLTMVTPSRWFAGGRGLDDYRAEMLADRRLRALVDYPNAAEAFPGIQIKGGVSYFLWDAAHNGPCDVVSINNGTEGARAARFLDEYDVLVRNNEAVSILNKVSADVRVVNLASNVSAIQPFSIRTSYRGKPSGEGMKSPVLLYQNGGTAFIEHDEIPRNTEWVNQWKVLLGAAYGAGDSIPHQITNYPIIAAPGSACTETYLVIGRFSSEQEAKYLAAYLRTRFVRFLVSLRKNTQHIYSDRFSFVPSVPMDRFWTDVELYATYGLTNDEQVYIESVIKPMSLDRRVTNDKE